MNNCNYDVLMTKTLESLEKESQMKRLLLHACCAPCATACIERVKDSFDVTVYFYNPNMDTKEEYVHRAKDLKRLCAEFKVNCIVEEYDSAEFYSVVKGIENQPEGGSRCAKCFELRLRKTAEYAEQNGYDYFATTLSVSPLKNAHTLNMIGLQLEKEQKVHYLPSDFKKRNGYMRTIELSKEYGLYRQNYCGCVFSKRKTDAE